MKSSVFTDKMTLYGFGPNFCELMTSYLSHRSQVVLVNSAYSDYKPNIAGVPQGSILGPILFNIYANELPSLCHQNCTHSHNNIGEREELFGSPCNTCGRFVTFADDSTIIFRGLKGEYQTMSEKIDNKLIIIEDFLAANNLKLNISKTQILRTASRQ